MSSKIIGITISVFNEEGNLQKVIEETRGVMQNTAYKYFIHIQDDGSLDTSVLIGEKYADFVSVHPMNKGLAKTFQDGIHACSKHAADIIVHIDGDGQYILSSLPAMISEIEKGADMVIGSRFLGGNHYTGKWSRNIGNILFSGFISLLCRKKLSDVTSGFRVFDKKIIEIPITSTFTYTYEQVIRASRLRYVVIDISAKTRESRESHLMKNSFQYIQRALRDIFRILVLEPVSKHFL